MAAVFCLDVSQELLLAHGFLFVGQARHRFVQASGFSLAMGTGGEHLGKVHGAVAGVQRRFDSAIHPQQRVGQNR